MNKRSFLIFVLSGLLLCGCAPVEGILPDIPPVPTNAAGSVMHNTQHNEVNHRHISIDIGRSETLAYDPREGTEHILSFSYEQPRVRMMYNSAAADRINDTIAHAEESFYTGDIYGSVYDSGHSPGYNNMLTSAEDNYNYIVNSQLEEAVFEMVNSRTVEIKRCDESVMSLLFMDYLSLAGMHGSYAYRGYVFDTGSGELLSLDSIAEEPAAFKDFLLQRLLLAYENEEELRARLSGFVDAEFMPTAEEAFSALIRDGSWYFGNDGFVIFSDLYELCSYADGTIDFVIPYSELEGYIKPRYMPYEITGSAEFRPIPAESGNEIAREIIDMVKVDEGGEMIYLVLQGMAKDVSLTLVDYTDQFYDTAQIWYCSAMNDCALQIQTVLPEGMPRLKLSYTDSSGRHELLLSQNGVDGGLQLVDDSIQAVG